MTAPRDRDLAGRRLWIGVPGRAVDDATRRLLDDVRPGGVVLFRRNLGPLDGVVRLVRDLRSHAGPDLAVSVDQEHGLVVRFDRELTVFPGAMALGATGVREPSFAEHLAEASARRAGEELASLGIDVVLAPVADLATHGDNPGLGVRSFSGYAKLAGRLVAATVRGHAAAGVASTLKHFPGLGGAAADSHEDLPTTRTAVGEDRFEPFAAGIAAGAEIVMSTHCVAPDLDAGTPATFSAPTQRDLLRGRLGFRGVLVSDDLEMGAMARRFGFDETTQRAAAVHDVLCVCADPAKQRRAAEILRDALARGDDACGDFAAAEERLDVLARRTARARGASAAPFGPDAESARLADAIAGRAVTVVGDPARLLPLRADEPLLAVLPRLDDATGAEDPLRGERLEALIAALPPGSETRDLAREPSSEDAAALCAAARRFRRVLLGTTLARFRPAEAAAVRALLAAHDGVVWVALRNPFDFEVAPESATAARVTAYGFRPVHLRALVAVLFGRVSPYGVSPVVLRNS